MTFYHGVTSTFLTHKDRPAWLLDNTELTYGQVFERVQATASALESRGVKPRDTVLIVAENSAEVAIVILACLWRGFDACPVNPSLTEQELAACVETVEPQLVVHLRRNLPAKIISSIASVTAEELFAAARPAVGEWPEPELSGRLLLFTSGSVGEPKIVVLNADRHWLAATRWVEYHPFLKASSRFWNYFPMSYNAGILNLLLIPLAAGASVYISQSFSSVQLLRFLDIVEKKNITVLWVNPTVLRTLYKFFEKHPGINRIKEQVDGVFTGMAPLPRDEKTKFEEWLGLQIYENYALTETQFLTSTYRCERTCETVGKVLPWIDLIVDGDDNILVKAETLFEGYMRQGKALRVPELKNDYFATGDLGRLTGGNELKLTGRAKESIKRGGYLVEFAELEQLAILSPFVEEALAIPVTDDLYGENTVVCLVLRDGSSAEHAVADVAKQYAAKLAPYKFPKEIAVMKAFPKSSSGKTLRRQVQQIYLQNQVVHAASL